MARLPEARVRPRHGSGEAGWAAGSLRPPQQECVPAPGEGAWEG